ncbi:MAG: FAD-dependent oxidoreductase [Desulfobulbaceae bacterium]|nr:FAD-dependent oxidoreductase [Desulfobulbaceae bacterium]
MSQKILIVGGVALGPKAASRAKRLDPTAEIILIDQDSVISYGGCGIPYYVSGDIDEAEGLRSTSFHSIRDADYFAREKGFAVRTSTRALKIDRLKKQLLVKDLNSGKDEFLPYDKLVLATGSTPFVPPIPGADADGIFTVSDIHKAIAIKSRLSQGRVSRAVVLGGGAIGLEMAEAMADLWAVETTVVEMMDQILPRLIDKNIALMAQRHLEEKGVKVYTSERAASFCVEDGKVNGVKTDKRTIEADLVILSVGVRTNTQLARDAGLAIGSFGGIVVNKRMQTSDPSIYAGGDCVEVPDLVSGGSSFAPMGSLANRQGRVIGSNLAGKQETFDGMVGSFIIKLFDNCVSKTGLSLESAKAMGFDALAAQQHALYADGGGKGHPAGPRRPGHRPQQQQPAGQNSSGGGNTQVPAHCAGYCQSGVSLRPPICGCHGYHQRPGQYGAEYPGRSQPGDQSGRVYRAVYQSQEKQHPFCRCQGHSPRRAADGEIRSALAEHSQ